MDERLKLAGLTGRMAFTVAAEKLLNPRPTKLTEVPPSPEHLTPQWLTLALCDGVPGAAVNSFELGPRNDGTSARRQLRVDYNEEGTAASLPEYLFTKSSPDQALHCDTCVECRDAASSARRCLQLESDISAISSEFSAAIYAM